MTLCIPRGSEIHLTPNPHWPLISALHFSVTLASDYHYFISLFFSLWFLETTVMGNTERVRQVFDTATLVANFLFKTGRILIAKELFKESMILLNNMSGFVPIGEQKSAIGSHRMYRECDTKYVEGMQILEHGKIYHNRGKYQKAKHLYIKALTIMKKIGDKNGEAACYLNLGNVSQSLSEYVKAEEYFQKALQIKREIGDKDGEAKCYRSLGNVFQHLSEYVKAEEYLQKALQINREIGDKGGEAACYINVGIVFQHLSEYVKAEEYLQKALQIEREIGDKDGEAACYINLGIVFQHLSEYVKAEEYLQKALQIKREIGDKGGEAACYLNLGNVSQSLSEYVKAEEYLQKALQIKREIGDKDGEAACYGNLGNVFRHLSEYVKAEEYLQKALQINREIGDKDGEAASYGNLGNVSQSLSEYVKAEEYFQKALQIKRETGDKDGEAKCYGSLGNVFQHLSEYVKAEEYLQRALHIQREIGDKDGEAASYISLGIGSQSLGEYVKAEEYLQKALQIKRETGDKDGKAACYINLGNVFQHLSEYVKAEEYLQKALQIKREIGDKDGEAACYINLGNVFQHLSEYVKAEEYFQKALQINREIGDKDEEAACYTNLGIVSRSLSEYVKAEEYLQKALQINREIGDKDGEAACYTNLGIVSLSLSEYVKAEEYVQKALQIKRETGDKDSDARCYLIVGDVLFQTGEYLKAKQAHEKALAQSNEIGSLDLQRISLLSLAWDTLRLTGNIDEAVSSLLGSIEKCEQMRMHLRNNDQYKISFLDKCVSPYKLLRDLFLETGKFKEALCTEELSRARALADLMSAQYSVEQQASVNPRSWFNIERIETKESSCSCLYISCHHHQLLLWVIKPNKTIQFQMKNLNDHFGNKTEGRSSDEIFDDITFRLFPFPLTEEHCEDRSLFPSKAGYLKQASSWEEKTAVFRPVEKDEDENQYIDPPNLSHCYKMIIGPVADLLVEPEIIIVPDRVLCKVPFSAFKDENDKYLAETYRIRIVPSLTTLRLIQESPEDYHSQTDVLIVGEPKVGEVYHKGRRETLCPLPGAKEEAEMIARLLGVQPLLGEQATKQAVLQRIHLVGLIHFAAHGDAERGEIALAPPLSFEGIPSEEHYLLTMAEISQVRLRAKLVVLSCCHSARGQIRSEGVVGIARAFLGSGARSVLAALWAIEDLATKQFMRRFYEHLVRGESASESLHQTMKWMRSNGFSEVRQWAPFMLIGDDVTFDFGK